MNRKLALIFNDKRDIEIRLSSNKNKIIIGSPEEISDAFLDVAILC